MAFTACGILLVVLGSVHLCSCVEQLDGDNFVKSLKSRPFAVVGFVAGGAEHAAALESELATVERLLMGGPGGGVNGVMVGVLDGAAEDTIADWFKVTTFPTVKFCARGKAEAQQVFTAKAGGGAAEIADWATKCIANLEPSVAALTERSIGPFLSKHSHVLVKFYAVSGGEEWRVDVWCGVVVIGHTRVVSCFAFLVDVHPPSSSSSSLSSPGAAIARPWRRRTNGQQCSCASRVRRVV